MAFTLETLRVVKPYNQLEIRYLKESGGYHRKFLSPDDDVSGEVQEVKDKAEEVWTDEVKTAWETFKAEQDAKIDAKIKALRNPE